MLIYSYIAVMTIVPELCRGSSKDFGIVQLLLAVCMWFIETM